jgi:hypothetical protein
MLCPISEAFLSGSRIGQRYVKNGDRGGMSLAWHNLSEALHPNADHVLTQFYGDSVE